MRKLVFASVFIFLPGVAFAETKIGQKDKHFSTESLAVKPGESVRFINDDSVSHNISVKDPDGSSRPGVVEKPGEEVTLNFDKSGSHAVHCLIHPKMKMLVHVE